MQGNCEVCGQQGNLKETEVYLTDYGVRTKQTKMLCQRCRVASRRGLL